MKPIQKSSGIQRCKNETPYWLQAAGTPGLAIAVLKDGCNVGHDNGGKPIEVQHNDTVNGAWSLLTTARDYTLLLEAYLAQGMQELYPEVYTRQVGIDERLGWSLGWGTAGDVLWQWGHNDGFKAFAALKPADGRGIVTLTNGECGQRINREWVNAWLGTDLPAFYFGALSL